LRFNTRYFLKDNPVNFVFEENAPVLPRTDVQLITRVAVGAGDAFFPPPRCCGISPTVFRGAVVYFKCTLAAFAGSLVMWRTISCHPFPAAKTLAEMLTNLLTNLCPTMPNVDQKVVNIYS